MKKTTKLKKLLKAKKLTFLMEAHNGLSAKIVEEAGFNGIWASGLAISASLGIRDSNEASWTQVLEVLEFMSDATSIPILLDGDTGYGNFNNARRLVRKLEQRKIAGVCIEDKLFPKTNSFLRGEYQPLAEIEEFCGKIKAMKDTQQDQDFQVIARVEALIAGFGLTEAVRRARAYSRAGADAILIHSKQADFSEIANFMSAWDGEKPVIIVPTKYYNVPTKQFREMGVSMVIWANHNLRAAVAAMQNTSQQIFREETLCHIESSMPSLDEIFRLQDSNELAEAEKNYLPQGKSRGGKAGKIISVKKDKYNRYLLLKESASLSAHLPETCLLSEKRLWPMLRRYREVILKPVAGRRGKGVFKLSADGRRIYSLHSENTTIAFKSKAQTYHYLSEQVGQQDYMIQRRVNLAEIDGRPLDFRVMAQRRHTGEEWTITAKAVKVAGPGYIVTNNKRSKGTVLAAQDALRQLQLANDVGNSLLATIDAVALEAAKQLSLKHPLHRVWGFDIGVDKQNHVWIIEANYWPMKSHFRKLPDQSMYLLIKEFEQGNEYE